MLSQGGGQAHPVASAARQQAPRRRQLTAAIMFIGILQFELLIHGSMSLKDKRRVVKSVKDRLHREHLVSVAEIAALDHHRLAVLGLAVVANSAPYVSSVLDAVIAKLRALRDAQLGDCAREILHGNSLPEEGCEHEGADGACGCGHAHEPSPSDSEARS